MKKIKVNYGVIVRAPLEIIDQLHDTVNEFVGDEGIIHHEISADKLWIKHRGDDDEVI